MALRSAFRGGYQDRPGWWLGFDFDQNLIDGLKAWIPARDRAWNPETKCWWVSIDQEAKLVAFLPGFEAFTKQGSLF